MRRRPKYKNKRTIVNGISFPSKLEAEIYRVLMRRQEAGEIKDLRCQHPVVLQEGPPKVRISWKVDFSFTEKNTGEIAFAEAKGIETSDYKLKLKLWRKNPPAPLEIWKGTYKYPMLKERIEKE